jgi:hypothetical protein
MPTFNNGESAASVRTKINDAIDKVDGASPITSADINGGTIDGVTIGGASAGAGTFTTLTATGNVTLGDAATDTVTFTADVASNLIPSADNTYDLGASGSEWKDLFIDGTANIDSLVADTADINGGTIDGTVIGGSTPAAISGTTGTFSGNLTVDTNTLFVDAANNRVGVGTSSPVVPLDVIGTIRGGSGTVAANYSFTLRSGTSDTTNLTRYFSGLGEIRHAGGAFQVVTQDSNPLIFSPTTERMRIDSSGKVGIGTSSPATTLEVVGAIRASGATPVISILDTGGATDEKNWHIVGANGPLQIQGLTDAGSSGGGFVQFTRSGNNVQTLQGYRTAALRYELSNWDNHLLFAAADSTVGTSSAHALVLDTNNLERMRIDSSGNVGIGTTDARPSSKLTLTQGVSAINDGASAPFFQWYNANSGTDLKYWRIGNLSGGTLSFQTVNDAYSAAIERMRIDSSGKVGIGTSSPAEKLDVAGNIKTTAATYNFVEVNSGTVEGQFAANGSGDAVNVRAVSNHPLAFLSNNLERMRIDSSGNVLIGGTTAGTASAGNLVLVNGTAPTGNVTNGITLYAEDVSASSELKVRDEAGNVTTLSPHNFELIPEGPSEDMAWSYYSERDGKRINVDMLKAIRLLEQITGEKLVHMA